MTKRLIDLPIDWLLDDKYIIVINLDHIKLEYSTVEIIDSLSKATKANKLAKSKPDLEWKYTHHLLR